MSCKRFWTAVIRLRTIGLLFILLASTLAAAGTTSVAPLSAEALGKLVFEQKLQQQISLDLQFFDEGGQPVKLRRYFGKKPIILVAGYYECPMLCSIVFNGLLETLQDLKWKVGDQFDVISFSIDPRETPSVAAAKKRVYVKRYGVSRAAGGWHFLTGEEPAIRQLAEEIGFHYAYDPASKQYAHPSGFVVLTPQGRVSHYFFGVNHAPKQLHAALQEAAANKIGSPVEQFLFLCFHYNPITGKYGGLIMTVVRVLGASTVLGLARFVMALARSKSPREPEVSSL